MFYVEIAVTLTGYIILLGYQVLYVRKVRRAPLSTFLGFLNRTRIQWVESIIKDRRDILAVQTLRNWTMAATFLASTAIVLALAFIKFMVTMNKVSEIAHLLNFYGSRSDTLLMIKLLSNVIVFLFTFFNFTLAVRYYNYVAFMINLPANQESPDDHKRVEHTINRGAAHYNLGMHGYYTAIPIALWIIGPVWFFLGALLVTFVMSRLDRFA